MISMAATVMATGAAMAITPPQATTCRHVNVFVGRALVGSGKGSGQKAGREGAMLAG